ncbi:hypothetical protein RF11_07480 [Thelohanellus kitauei]|uniref:Uncharacterized protein n=1 Tax=Thelohanellus kitauei TaxID=669202 RepID=A0A0C2M037_THEKT|nr:hypothetical protein RF11_07480 [Thelohanellus kitauei]
MNFVPDGYKPVKSVINSRFYELFNVPESEEDHMLFFNGYPSNYLSYRRIKTTCHEMKMSPNTIQVRHAEGLIHRLLGKIFDGLVFHNISHPLTPNGVWKLYVANRNDYLLLFGKPYFIEQEIYRIFNGIPIESVYQTDDFNWHVAFKAENFEAARFGLLPNQSTSFMYT